MQKVVALVAAAIAGGFAAAPSPRAMPRDRAVEALVAKAASLPPEFSADLLLRLSALPTVTDARKRQLIDDASVAAGGAPEPFRVRMPAFVPIDSRQGAQVRAAQLALDRVTLGSRAALAMAPLDGGRARQLFDAIDFERQPAACDAALVPDVDVYYAAAADIARRTYRSPDDALMYFGYHVWRARLATELPGVWKAVRRFQPARDETAFLDGIVRVLLERRVPDARGLSVAGVDVVRSMSELAASERALGLDAVPLFSSLRKYLVAQLSASRCADDLQRGTVRDAFNRELADAGIPAADVAPIGVREAAPARVLGAARVDRYWQEGEALRFWLRLADLVGPDRRPFTAVQRQRPEWHDRALALAADLEQWDGPRGAEALDRFYQRQMIAGRLAEIAVTPDVKLRAVQIVVDGERHAAPRAAWRAVWFVPPEGLLELARGDRDLAAALSDAGEPVTESYARLQELGRAGRGR